MALSKFLLAPLVSPQSLKFTGGVFLGSFTYGLHDACAYRITDANYDDIPYNPFNSVVERVMYPQAGPVTKWNVGYNENAAFAVVEMPGIEKEDVKVWVEKKWASCLHMKGKKNARVDDGNVEVEGAKAKNDNSEYYSVLHIPRGFYKTNEMVATVWDGRLCVMIPRVKPKDEANVLEVKVFGRPEVE